MGDSLPHVFPAHPPARFSGLWHAGILQGRNEATPAGCLQVVKRPGHREPLPAQADRQRRLAPFSPGHSPAPARVLNAWWALWLPTFLTWPLFWTPRTALLSGHPVDATDCASDDAYEL
ncbi:hypothetical protein JCM4914_00650 [Streptomyces platensis subsp. malvinus]